MSVKGSWVLRGFLKASDLLYCKLLLQLSDFTLSIRNALLLLFLKSPHRVGYCL